MNRFREEFMGHKVVAYHAVSCSSSFDEILNRVTCR